MKSLLCAAAALWLLACGGSGAPVQKIARSRPLPAAPAPAQSPLATIPAKDVVFGLNAGDQGYRNCFDAAAGVAQRVHLSWTVDRYGSPGDFEADGESVSPAVVDCLVERVSARQFRADEPARANWTFVVNTPRTSKLSKKELLQRKKRRQRRRADDGGTLIQPAGALPSSEVDSVVHGAFELYGHCLRTGFANDSKLSGKLVLSWSLDERGRVRDVSDAGSDIDQQGVIDCAAEAFYAMQFPPPERAPAQVTYPILFNEGD